MSDKNSISFNLTPPFFSLLTLVLAVAKLAGRFDHSWWVVFAPLWFPPVFFFGGIFVLLLILGIVYFIVFSINYAIESRRFKRDQKAARERLNQVIYRR